MTTFTHQLLSRKTSSPEVWQWEREYSSRSAMVSAAVLRMGYTEVVFIQPGKKLDTTWHGALHRLATRHQGEMWPLQILSLQQDSAPSHKARNTETCSVRTFSSLSQTFCPLNSLDLNTVNLTSGVLFSRRSTIIKVSPQWTKWRQWLSKAWQKLPHGTVVANSSSPFYLQLMLFERWRHYFPRLIQINYGVMFRMKRRWFVPNLIKICSIFLKL